MKREAAVLHRDQTAQKGTHLSAVEQVLILHVEGRAVFLHRNATEPLGAHLSAVGQVFPLHVKGGVVVLVHARGLLQVGRRQVRLRARVQPVVQRGQRCRGRLSKVTWTAFDN